MPGVTDYIPLGNGSGIVKAKAPSNFIGKTLEDIGFGPKDKNGAAVLMIQRGKEGIINPSVQEVISHVDILVMAGNNTEIERMLEKADKAEKTAKQ
jgi:uncharacterized protein with PhoU and TrkA domain